MNYTKGEWKKEGNKIKVFGRGTIAICPSPTDDEGVFEFAANAHIIAAAPEMYEALAYLTKILKKEMFGEAMLFVQLEGADILKKAKGGK